MEEDYPQNLLEFEDRFNTEAKCIEYLRALRWPEGYICPHCGEKSAWRTNRGLLHCIQCGPQTLVTAGTSAQQAMMIDPTPLRTLKGPALPILKGAANLNLDPIDEDRNHNI